MLVDFKIKNFRSFKKEQEFSMQTGERLRKHSKTNTFKFKKENLVKSSLIFGANANGKSNLLSALEMLRRLVVQPTSSIEEELFYDTYGNNSKNTKFEITFIKNNKKYIYCLEYNRKRIVKETLKTNKEYIFKRIEQNFLLLPQQLKSISSNIRDNQLLLYFGQQNNEPNSKEAYHWIAQDLVFVNTDNINTDKFEMFEDKKFKKKVLYFIQAADFDIVDIEVKPVTVPNFNYIFKKLIKNQDSEDSKDDTEISKETSINELYCKHRSKNGTFTLNFDQESRGTKVFIILALYILSNENKVLLIDEFDRSYHLELAKALVSLINSEKQTNQFLLTTHELSLMDCRLRSDQIWFVEKDRCGVSELYSLFDFDDPALRRSDFNYKRRYLEGRYGATQIVNQELLMEALEDNE